MLQPPFAQRVLTAWFALFGITTCALAAGPRIAFDPKAAGVRLVRKQELGGKVESQFVVNARGATAVAKYYGTITGILFQATARTGESLRELPAELSYTLKGDHDAVLHVRIGKRKAVSDAPAWVWAVAAMFAQHGATGAITMFDQPRTPAERRFERRWRAENRGRQRLLWARYHPAVDNTLVGFFLMNADAIVGDPVKMRTVTNGLRDFEKYAGYSVTIDRARSLRAARTLDRIISASARPGDCAMLNDVDETFVFTIADGKLRISGVPNYHFARKSRTGGFKEINELTANCRRNRKLFAEVNPLVYKTIDDVAKLVAFFNSIHETEPEKLEAFVKTLKPVFDRIPTIETPIALPYRAR